MTEYKSPSFEKSSFEITDALSTLKRYGINIQLPEHLVKQLDATTLFDGDDGLFKELIKSQRNKFSILGNKYKFLSNGNVERPLEIVKIDKFGKLKKVNSCQ